MCPHSGKRGQDDESSLWPICCIITSLHVDRILRNSSGTSLTLTKGPSSSSPARMESDVSHSLNHASCLCSRITNRWLAGTRSTIRPTSSQLQMRATRERPRLNSPMSLTNPSVHGWQRFEPKPHRFTEKAFVRLHPTPIAIRLPCGSSTAEQPTRM